LIEWYYQAGSEKSPDQSFRPINIQTGNNLAKLVPGSTAIVYPTFTIEVGKTHESYRQLLDDAELKHFSPTTSIQIWLGIKLFTRSGRMQIALKVRDTNIGYGSDSAGLIETAKISIFQATDIQIIVAKARVYFGVPQGQVPLTRLTIPGPNALPVPQVPYGSIDDFVIDVELIRQRVMQNCALKE